MSAKRLTGPQALAAWPDRLANLRADPSDEALQRLCHLLDAVERWVVQRWGQTGHGERLASLTGCRSEALQANHLVSTTLRATKAARAAPDGLEGTSVGDNTGRAPTAA